MTEKRNHDQFMQDLEEWAKDDSTAPLKREWVGLTDDEIGVLTVFDGLHHVETPLLADFVQAVQAKLKEKNT